MQIKAALAARRAPTARVLLWNLRLRRERQAQRRSQRVRWRRCVRPSGLRLRLRPAVRPVRTPRSAGHPAHRLAPVLAHAHRGPQIAPYRPDNLLDRLSAQDTLEAHYRHLEQRERELLARNLGITRGRVLTVGCGWHPGRHLFPAPQFQLVAVDADPARVEGVAAAGTADETHVGHAGALDFPSRSFDVVLYRLVLHHIAYQGPLTPCFQEAARLLKPGGAMVAIEPGLWHPVGATLAVANRLGFAPAIHGTPDDIPISPNQLADEALAAGLMPELHAVTYSWRRLPTSIQRAAQSLDSLGSRPKLAPFGHTLLLIARA